MLYIITFCPHQPKLLFPQTITLSTSFTGERQRELKTPFDTDHENQSHKCERKYSQTKAADMRKVVGRKYSYSSILGTDSLNVLTEQYTSQT